jgi:hypothetical protein
MEGLILENLFKLSDILNDIFIFIVSFPLLLLPVSHSQQCQNLVEFPLGL